MGTNAMHVKNEWNQESRILNGNKSEMSKVRINQRRPNKLCNYIEILGIQGWV